MSNNKSNNEAVNNSVVESTEVKEDGIKVPDFFNKEKETSSNKKKEEISREGRKAKIIAKRKKKFKFQILLAIIFGVVIGSLSIITANKIIDNQPHYIKAPSGYDIYYASYNITGGDNLEKLSKSIIYEYDMTGKVTVDDMVYTIGCINNIDPNHITSGKYIIIPIILKDNDSIEAYNNRNNLQNKEDSVIIEPNK